MKKAIGMWALCLVVLCLLFVPSSFGFGIASYSKSHLDNEAFQAEQDKYKYDLAIAENAIIASVDSFNRQRSFDIYYGDLKGINNIFDSIAGISVQNVIEILPMEDFRAGPYYDGSVTPAAVRYDLVAEDISSAMLVIERMQLPVHTVTIQYPNQIYLTFMTGGEL